MPKKSYNVELMQPGDVDNLKSDVKEFITRLSNVDSEIELLKEDRKNLVEEFKTKLDMKTLQAALKVYRIQNSIPHKDTFELFLNTLEEGE